MGTEVGAQTRGLRPVLLVRPPALHGLARPRGGAQRPGRAGPGAGTGLAAGAARGEGTPGEAQASRRTPGAGGRGEQWPGSSAEEASEPDGRRLPPRGTPGPGTR